MEKTLSKKWIRKNKRFVIVMWIHTYDIDWNDPILKEDDLIDILEKKSSLEGMENIYRERKEYPDYVRYQYKQLGLMSFERIEDLHWAYIFIDPVECMLTTQKYGWRSCIHVTFDPLGGWNFSEYDAPTQYLEACFSPVLYNDRNTKRIKDIISE